MIKTAFLDLDGVVADLLPVWLHWYEDLYSEHIEPEQITEWDVSKFVRPGNEKAIFGILDNKFLFLNLPVVDGAKAAIRELKDSGISVTFCSSGMGRHAASEKQEWVDRHFSDIGLTRRNTIITEEKHHLSYVPDSIIIDDYIKNVSPWGKNGILFGGYPYQKSVEHPTRASTWEEALQVIKEL